MKKLALIHTVEWFHKSVVNPFATPWLKENPEVKIINICDDSLLSDSLLEGKMTPEVASRIISYAKCADDLGADVIMITCTTVNETAAMARKLMRTPVFNIDEPMAEQAVAQGSKIGIVATVPTSSPCTERLLREKAAEKGKSIEVHTITNEAAFQALLADDIETHDRLVKADIDKMAEWADVITLGQISLAQISHDCGKPIFQVGRSGFAEAKRLLFDSGESSDSEVLKKTEATVSSC